MVDYRLLGGLLGSAWREQQPEHLRDNDTNREGAINRLMHTFYAVGIDTMKHDFHTYMKRAMKGLCVLCGGEAAGIWSSGVPSCGPCAVPLKRLSLREPEKSFAFLGPECTAFQPSRIAL